MSALSSQLLNWVLIISLFFIWLHFNVLFFFFYIGLQTKNCMSLFFMIWLHFFFCMVLGAFLWLTLHGCVLRTLRPSVRVYCRRIAEYVQVSIDVQTTGSSNLEP